MFHRIKKKIGKVFEKSGKVLEEEPKKKLISKTIKSITKKKISEEEFDKIWINLEVFLLEINVAFEIVEKIKISLQKNLVGNLFDRFSLSKAIKSVLVEEITKVLQMRESSFLEELEKKSAQVSPVPILILGVNGVGKTTTIGKLIWFLQEQGFSVVVAASDTFRAAAVEQIKKHCDKLKVKCISHSKKSDPAAVSFDAIEHAKAKEIDIVLIDTAGRMPNNHNLMMELQKIKRVSEAQMTLFIGDSILGNDLIDQIELFDKGVDIDGIILTKTDTDERPGSIVTAAYSIEKPIYFLGVGQEYNDLVEFDAEKIAENMFEDEED